jgi:methylmalonyl-CoA mutase N-terminal domain/subunit
LKRISASEIATASYAYQTAIESGEKIAVGVNGFTSEKEEPIDLLQIDASAAEKQTRKLAALRRGATMPAWRAARRPQASGRHRHTMPLILDCVRAYATLGEICDAMRQIFGTYQEKSWSDAWRRRSSFSGETRSGWS